VDNKTFNLLYNINKTLNEGGEGYCSKNGCSFNSDFLNNTDDDQSSIRRKPYSKSSEDYSQKSTEEHSDKNDEPDNDTEFHKPVLGSNLVSGY